MWFGNCDDLLSIWRSDNGSWEINAEDVREDTERDDKVGVCPPIIEDCEEGNKVDGIDGIDEDVENGEIDEDLLPLVSVTFSRWLFAFNNCFWLPCFCDFLFVICIHDLFLFRLLVTVFFVAIVVFEFSCFSCFVDFCSTLTTTRSHSSSTSIF